MGPSATQSVWNGNPDTEQRPLGTKALIKAGTFTELSVEKEDQTETRSLVHQKQAGNGPTAGSQGVASPSFTVRLRDLTGHAA